MDTFKARFLVEGKKKEDVLEIEAEEFEEAYAKALDYAGKGDKVKVTAIEKESSNGIMTYEGKALDELLLSEADIKRAYENGIITIECADQYAEEQSGVEGVCASIGDFYFYFGEDAGEYDNLGDYMNEHTPKEIVEALKYTLDEMITEFPTEYAYYKAYVREELEQLDINKPKERNEQLEK